MKFPNSTYYSLGLAVILATSIVWLNFKSTKKPNVFLEGKALGVFYAIKKKQPQFLIKLPEEFKKEYFCTINELLKNTAYSSSGGLEKFYVDEYGNKHSHLIDPRTGYPIKTVF